MNITAETKTDDLWKATQDQRNRAKEYYGVGTIILSELVPQSIGDQAADFIRGACPEPDPEPEPEPGHDPEYPRLSAAAPELLAALEGLFRECAMVHNRWGSACNSKESEAAITAARAAIEKAKA